MVERGQNPTTTLIQRLQDYFFAQTFLIAEDKIDTTPLITHRFALKDIEKAYDIFENKLDGVIKIAIVSK